MRHSRKEMRRLVESAYSSTDLPVIGPASIRGADGRFTFRTHSRPVAGFHRRNFSVHAEARALILTSGVRNQWPVPISRSCRRHQCTSAGGVGLLLVIRGCRLRLLAFCFYGIWITAASARVSTVRMSYAAVCTLRTVRG
jgi:hypothetical protein